MTELIVALDVEETPQFEVLFHRLRVEAGVRFFKIGATALLVPPWWGDTNVVSYMRRYDVDVFLDLKIYDTRDTVERVARRAFDLGARFLTVHATPSMLAAAMRAKPPEDYCKVLAVAALTDGEQQEVELDDMSFDGLVCSAVSAAHNRPLTNKLLVCPGIRPPGWDADNHKRPATPSDAAFAGADYIVCGRPIYDAMDPVAAARAIIEELG